MRNVRLEKIKDFVNSSQNEPEVLNKTIGVEVLWNMDEESSQMNANVSFGKGQEYVEIDMPDFLGGEGRKPSPLHYCLVGIASCFLGTFATICKELGLNIESLKIRAKNKVNLTLPLGLGDKPVTEGIDLEIIIKSSENPECLEKAKEEALKRCPGVWCMKNSIPVKAIISNQ
ncbi:MAG: OsmC family protein [bacterium]